MAFTPKQKAFIELKALGVQNKQAAIQAGFASNSAAVTATGLMNRADIKAAVKKATANVEATDAVGEIADSGWAMKDEYASPLDLMKDVWNNPKAPKTLRYQAAKDALPYCHARKEGGKKEEAADKSKKAAKGKFGTARRPSHLSVVK